MAFVAALANFLADALVALALAALLAVPLAALYDYLARAAPALPRGHYVLAFLGVAPFATHWVVARAAAAGLASPGRALLAGVLAEAVVVVLTCVAAVRLGGGHAVDRADRPRDVWVPVPAFVPPRLKSLRRG